MNSASEDIKDMLLADSDLALTFAQDLFVGKEPAMPDNCVTIYDTPGYPPILTLGNDAEYYYPSVQIRVRNRSYLNGYAMISSIVRTLHGRANESWNGITYTAVICVSDPAILDWDENGRVRFISNFNLQRRP